MDDIFHLVKEGNALNVKVWLNRIENNPNQS